MQLSWILILSFLLLIKFKPSDDDIVNTINFDFSLVILPKIINVTNVLSCTFIPSFLLLIILKPSDHEIINTIMLDRDPPVISPTNNYFYSRFKLYFHPVTSPTNNFKPSDHEIVNTIKLDFHPVISSTNNCFSHYLSYTVMQIRLSYTD